MVFPAEVLPAVVLSVIILSELVLPVSGVLPVSSIPTVMSAVVPAVLGEDSVVVATDVIGMVDGLMARRTLNVTFALSLWK